MSELRESKKLRIRLNEIERAEAADEKDSESGVTWNDFEDRALAIKEERVRGKNAVLDEVVPDRKCEGCGVIVLKIRSWVLRRRVGSGLSSSGSAQRSVDSEVGWEWYARCRKCWERSKIKARVQGLVNQKIFKKIVEVKWFMEPMALYRCRIELGISQREFARRVGWSAVYQGKLESGEIKWIRGEARDVILAVFSEFGVKTLDSEGVAEGDNVKVNE